MDPLEAFEDELRKQQAYQAELKSKGKYEPMDIPAVMNHEGHEIDWLVDGLWPMGRHIHIHAQRKAGKSLVSLWIACCLALGRDPFTGDPIPPRKVGYWDFEMTEDDFRERIADMGFDVYALSKMLNYYLMQPLPPLDTEQGGRALLEQATIMGEEVIFIDTMSRVISGDENSSDTYINFYRFTGGPLKAAGISVCRLDHEGHEGGRSRGSSAKADDVDIVFQLKPNDDGVTFVRKAARISWVTESISIIKKDEPLSYSRTAGAWPEGTREKALELDACDVPLDAGRIVASRMLRDKGYAVGKTITLAAALKYRRDRLIFP